MEGHGSVHILATHPKLMKSNPQLRPFTVSSQPSESVKVATRGLDEDSRWCVEGDSHHLHRVGCGIVASGHKFWCGIMRSLLLSSTCLPAMDAERERRRTPASTVHGEPAFDITASRAPAASFTTASS